MKVIPLSCGENKLKSRILLSLVPPVALSQSKGFQEDASATWVSPAAGASSTSFPRSGEVGLLQHLQSWDNVNTALHESHLPMKSAQYCQLFIVIGNIYNWI